MVAVIVVCYVGINRCPMSPPTSRPQKAVLIYHKFLQYVRDTVEKCL